MKFIKKLHDIIDFYAGKNEGYQHSPSDKDMAIHEAQIELFEELYSYYPKNTRINRILDPFKKSGVVLLQNGKGDLPPDFLREREVYVRDTDDSVEMLDDHQWSDAVKDPVSKPSVLSPIGKIDADQDAIKLFVRPLDVPAVSLNYFRRPVRPNYAFVVSGTRYVYDDEASTDIEFKEELHHLLVKQVLSKYGITIRDNDLITYGELQKQQNLPESP